MWKKRGGFLGATFAEKKRHVLALRASGLTQTEFCRQEGISRSSLYRWLRQVEEARRPVAGRSGHVASPGRERPLFAKLQIRPEGADAEAKSPAPSPLGVVIILSSGDQLFLSDACDPAWLGKVVRAFRSAPC